MRVRQVVMLMAAGLLVAACGKNAQPEVAATPAADSSAILRARQDSIDAANRRRAQEEADRRAEQERLAREAAARSQQLRSDLEAKIHFDYDQAAVQSTDQQTLDRKAAILQANPGVQLQIQGNADARGSDEYNLALGNRRALAAKQYLTNKGVDGSRLSTMSNGEEKPIAEGSDETAYAQNRRDDFVITTGADSLVAPQ